MIPFLTIDFDVVEARPNGRSAVLAGRVLFSFTSPAKLNYLDEPWEEVRSPPPKNVERLIQ